jgi:geranylgeranyl pyrophosphate synthase
LESDVEALVALMRETRALESVRFEAAERVSRAIEHLESLPESPARELLTTAAQLIVERQS